MVKVKVCGITNIEDALAAARFGADALGFVFARSPRQVTAPVVRDIVGQLPPFVARVGVFVDSELAEVQETMTRCGLDFAQLHGAEDDRYCAVLFPRAIKAFTIGSLPPDEELARYRTAALMIDKDKTSARNGAVLSQVWQLACRIKEYGPVILAGGLAPENVRDAIEAVRPYAVDVSSGIERQPGSKDHERMRAFLEAARSAGQGGRA